MFGGQTKIDPKAVTEWHEAIEFLDGFLNKSKYAAGDNLSIADITLMASAVTMQVKTISLFCIFFSHLLNCVFRFHFSVD